MTVKELISELQKYDENLPVELFDSESGYVDITEIFKSERPTAMGNYTKVNIC